MGTSLFGGRSSRSHCRFRSCPVPSIAGIYFPPRYFQYTLIATDETPCVPLKDSTCKSLRMLRRRDRNGGLQVISESSRVPQLPLHFASACKVENAD